MVRMWIKSPLLKRPKELEMPATATVKDLKRQVQSVFGKKRLVMLIGSEELSHEEESRSLRDLAIVNGTTINVLAKLSAGPLGNLNPDSSSVSEGSCRRAPLVLATSTTPTSFLSLLAPFLPSPSDSEEPPRPRRLGAKEVAANRRLKEHMDKLRANRQAHMGKSRPVIAKCFSVSEILPGFDPAAAANAAPSPSFSTPAQSPEVPLASPTSEKANPSLHCCSVCSKLLSTLQRVECRCSLLFCHRHRDPDKHQCQYDYKTHGKSIIAKDNPKFKRKPGSQNSPRLD